MKNRKKFFAFLLIFVMIVTCISPQQINAKTTGKKVAVTREEWICALLKQAHIKTGKVSKYHFSDTDKENAPISYDNVAIPEVHIRNRKNK